VGSGMTIVTEFAAARKRRLQLQREAVGGAGVSSQKQSAEAQQGQAGLAAENVPQQAGRFHPG